MMLLNIPAPPERILGAGDILLDAGVLERRREDEIVTIEAAPLGPTYRAHTFHLQLTKGAILAQASTHRAGG